MRSLLLVRSRQLRAFAGLLWRRLPSLSPGALVMYSLALAAELPVIITRLLLGVLVTTVVIELEGHPNATPYWPELALLPTAWSMLALLNPVGSARWWRIRAGGRLPSTREIAAYEDAVELLQAHTTTPLPLPARWFVLDEPHPDAGACGNALMLSRGLLESEHLPAVLAHELGHLVSTDARLTTALNRLVIFCSPFGATAEENDEQPERQAPEEPAREPIDDGVPLWASDQLWPWLLYYVAKPFIKALMFARGGLGLRMVGPALAVYWREREYKADQYAASLGQADELADFLEIHALIHDHPVPFIWLTEHTHPPTELRIDRLRGAAHTPALAAHDGQHPGFPQIAAS
jgi:Zn-dependent protease with chaperone function